MLHFAVSALAFTSPSASQSSVVSRRQAMGSIFGAGVGALSLAGATAAHAELYGDGKAGDTAQGAAARALKFAKAGEETEAFKVAERKRIEASNRAASGQKAKEETAEEAMARLGLRSYGGGLGGPK